MEQSEINTTQPKQSYTKAELQRFLENTQSDEIRQAVAAAQRRNRVSRTRNWVQPHQQQQNPNTRAQGTQQGAVDGRTPQSGQTPTEQPVIQPETETEGRDYSTPGSELPPTDHDTGNDDNVTRRQLEAGHEQYEQEKNTDAFSNANVMRHGFNAVAGITTAAVGGATLLAYKEGIKDAIGDFAFERANPGSSSPFSTLSKPSTWRARQLELANMPRKFKNRNTPISTETPTVRPGAASRPELNIPDKSRPATQRTTGQITLQEATEARKRLRNQRNVSTPSPYSQIPVETTIPGTRFKPVPQTIGKATSRSLQNKVMTKGSKMLVRRAGGPASLLFLPMDIYDGIQIGSALRDISAENRNVYEQKLQSIRTEIGKLEPSEIEELHALYTERLEEAKQEISQTQRRGMIGGTRSKEEVGKNKEIESLEFMIERINEVKKRKPAFGDSYI